MSIWLSGFAAGVMSMQGGAGGAGRSLLRVASTAEAVPEALL